MLLNLYGIHKLHKKKEILESLELQVARWVKAWEICAKQSPQPEFKLANTIKDVPYLGTTRIIYLFHCFFHLADIYLVGFDQLNDLVNKFQSFDIQSDLNFEALDPNRRLGKSLDEYHRMNQC